MSVLSTIRTINFTVIPRFTRTIVDQHVRETDTAEFTCDVYPENSPVLWMLRGSELDRADAKFEMSSTGKSRSLLIRGTAEEDAGIVSAVLGENDCHAELSVEGIYWIRQIEIIQIK